MLEPFKELPKLNTDWGISVKLKIETTYVSYSKKKNLYKIIVKKTYNKFPISIRLPM